METALVVCRTVVRKRFIAKVIFGAFDKNHFNKLAVICAFLQHTKRHFLRINFSRGLLLRKQNKFTWWLLLGQRHSRYNWNGPSEEILTNIWRILSSINQISSFYTCKNIKINYHNCENKFGLISCFYFCNIECS